MMPFAGWDMPVEYAGLASEHLAVRTRAVDAFNVNSTPTVFVNGVRFEGNTLAELEQLLAKLGAN